MHFQRMRKLISQWLTHVVLGVLQAFLREQSKIGDRMVEIGCFAFMERKRVSYWSQLKTTEPIRSLPFIKLSSLPSSSIFDSFSRQLLLVAIISFLAFFISRSFSCIFFVKSLSFLRSSSRNCNTFSLRQVISWFLAAWRWRANENYQRSIE